MDSFHDWQNIKSYENHIQHLRAINREGGELKPKSPKSFRTIHHPNITLTSRRKEKPTLKQIESRKILLTKYKTEPVLQIKNELRSPIPLVSDTEGTLIKQTLNSKNLSLKEKEHLLENYLLSRRILETKSVIKVDEIKQQYKVHRKLSRDLSSRSKNQLNLSQSRTNSYRKYEREKEEINQIVVGEGRNYLDIKIAEILLIKRVIVKNPTVLYNMIIKIRNQNYEIRSLTYNNLFNRSIRICFKKSILANHPEILINLSLMRENTELEIGSCKPVLTAFLPEEGKPMKSQVYKLIKSKIPVGTIEIEGKVTYFSKTPVNNI